MLLLVSVLPKPESSDKSVGVIASTAAQRQLLQLFHVAPAEDHVVGFQRCDEVGYNVRDMPLPPLYAPAVQASLPDKVFIGVLFVRQTAEFHRLDDAVHDHRRSQAGSQAQEQHLPALVAAPRLHGSVIDQLHRPAEGSFKIEPDPTAPQVVRFRDRHVMEHGARVTDGNGVVGPVASNPLNPKNHAPWSQRRSGAEPPSFGLAADQNFHVTATHIDNQHVH